MTNTKSYPPNRIKDRGNLIKAAMVMCSMLLITLAYTYSNVFYAKMPSDGRHRGVSSDYECLGCHNQARAGGDSFVYHFKELKCRKCHSQ